MDYRRYIRSQVDPCNSSKEILLDLDSVLAFLPAGPDSDTDPDSVWESVSTARPPLSNQSGEGSVSTGHTDHNHQQQQPQSRHQFSLPPVPRQSFSAEHEGIVPEIQNVVSTVNLTCSLNLEIIARSARNAEYNPKRFAAVTMRIRDPRTTAHIFHTGKMVCMGAKSEEQSRLAARKYARIIQKLGFPVKFTKFKIQNIASCADAKFHIRLEGILKQHSKLTSYEPEISPGLTYRMIKPKVVLLIFTSGKIIITGAKAREEIIEAIENIYAILLMFKK